MRLLRRKIYRAIPELDRFSDQQCEEYIKSANASVSRKVARWVVIAAVMGVCLSLTVTASWMVAVWMSRKLGYREEDALLMFGAIIAPGMLVGMCIGLVARDWILRVRVKRLIKGCGGCPDCRYTLTGTPLDERDAIRCPECGREIVASEAMGDFALDAKGVRVYLPRVVRVDERAEARRRKRHRAFLKWSVLSAAACLLLIGVGVGTGWVLLKRQATVAQAERQTVPRVQAGRAALWGVSAQSVDASQWEKLAAATNECLQIVNDVTNRVAAEASRSVYFDVYALAPETDQATYDKSAGRGAFEFNKRIAQEVVETAEASGVFERLAGCTSLIAPLRPTGEQDGLINLWGDGRAHLGRAVQCCVGRMSVALGAGNAERYAESVDVALTLADIHARQGTLLDMQFSDRSQMFVTRRVLGDAGSFKSADEVAALVAILERHQARPQVADVVEIERHLAMDWVQSFFGDPARVRNAMLGVDEDDFFGMKLDAKSVGSYRANRNGLNTMYDQWVDYAKKAEAGTPVPMPLVGGPLVIVNAMAPSVSRTLTLANSAKGQLASAIITLECVEFKLENGRWPSTINEIKARLGRDVPMIDPVTQTPFRLANEGERRTLRLPVELVRSDPDPAAPAAPSTPE